MAEDELKARRREEARRAMEGEEWRARRAQQEQLLARRREEARRAMEDPRHRERREGAKKARQAEERAAQARAAGEQQAQVASQAEAAGRARAVREAQETKAQKIASIKRLGQRVEELTKQRLTLSPIRTLKTDLARAVREEGMSLSKIAGVGKTLAGRPGAADRRWFLITLLVVVLLVAAGTYLGFNFYPDRAPIVPAGPLVEPLIVAEQNQAINVTGLTEPTAVRQKLLAESGRPDLDRPAVKNLYLTANDLPLNFKDFLRLTGLSFPATLNRYLADDYMFGVHFDGERLANFLVIQTSFFERAWSEMLAWEPELLLAVSPLLRATEATAIERQQPFQDKTVLNKDVRLVYDAQSQPILLYAFLDQRHLVITTAETTFIELFQRFIANN